ncbi:MAG: VPLPA-CTERM sorting domain-containing protein [Paracoccaceae bacterium]
MFKITLTAAALSLGLVGAASAATVFTEDFEADVAGAPSTLLNWTVVSGTIDVIPVGSSFDWYSPNGQYVDMNGSPAGPGRIETNSGLGLVLGQSYTLTFDYGNNKNSNAVEQLTFGIDGNTWVIDIAGAIPSFLTASFSFVFSGGSDTLFFADTGPTPGDAGGPIIDNISVAAVPVPAAGFLLLGALGGLAGLRRRRKTA